jgi:hypothetical protein
MKHNFKQLARSINVTEQNEQQSGRKLDQGIPVLKHTENGCYRERLTKPRVLWRDRDTLLLLWQAWVFWQRSIISRHRRVDTKLVLLMRPATDPV